MKNIICIPVENIQSAIIRHTLESCNDIALTWIRNICKQKNEIK